jgi:hypothetical protein
MKKLKQLVIFLNLLGMYHAFAQENKTHYILELQTTQASKNTVPFWLSANTYGRVQEHSSTLLYTAVAGNFKSETNKLQYSYKLGLTAYNATKNAIFIDELYGAINYKNWGLTIGIKQNIQLLEGLSSSNGNIAASTNARSYPGYNIYLKEFVALPFAKNWLAVKGNYGDFLLNDKRVVTNARLHTKSLFIKYKLNNTWEIITGLNHYAVWAGTSKIFGKQPAGFKNYLRVISGSSGGSDATGGDQINVIGNQLGTYLLQFNYKGNKHNWNFYWSHPFEDRSGRELMNYPDGLYGVFVDLKKPEGILSHVLAELTYTKHQSGGAPHYTDENGFHAASGMDNYFNNGVYQSGWTYFGNTIGSPFFPTMPKDEAGITSGIITGDNRLMAFNVGLKGTIRNIPYKMMLSHATYFGWFNDEYSHKPTQFSGLLEMDFPNIATTSFNITVGTAFDTGTYSAVNFGGFIKISKSGLF